MKFFTVFLSCLSLTLAKPSARIVGGQLARGGQFPFAAAIYVTKFGGTYFYAGSVVSNQWILTAAQCAESATSFHIQLGSNLLAGNDTHRVTVATSTYVLHPDYNPATFENDIALIKLRLPIEFNQYIGSITLPTTFIPDYTPVVAIGWGQVDDFTTGLSNELLFVSVSTISHDECQLTYGQQITHDMLCVAGNFNEGTCNGDMGGPLIQIVGANSVIVGVASFTSQNGCTTIDPAGFTRVIPFVDWIYATIAT